MSRRRKHDGKTASRERELSEQKEKERREESRALGLVSYLKQEPGVVVEDDCSGPGFGDRMTVLRAERIRVRVIRDRSLWYVTISEDSQPHEWYYVEQIREHLHGSKRAGALMSIEEQADFVLQNWHRIEDLFSKDRAKETHRALQPQTDEPH